MSTLTLPSAPNVTSRPCEHGPYAWVVHEVRQGQQDAARVRHPAGHRQPQKFAQGHLAHGDELALVELLLLPPLAPGSEEVVPSPAEVPVVTHLAEVDQLLRHVAGLFSELAGGAARERFATLNGATRQLPHH